jgi:hypothetical protein
MGSERTPVEDAVVVVGEISEGLESRIAEASGAKVEHVPGRPDMIVVELPKTAKDSRAARQRLGQLLHGRAMIEPVLTDETGARLFPTGCIRVNFHEPQPEEMLKSFAKRHNIRFLSRNRWQEKLADFSSMPEDKRSVIDIAKEVAKDETVEAAWPDVVGSFKRE